MLHMQVVWFCLSGGCSRIILAGLRLPCMLYSGLHGQPLPVATCPPQMEDSQEPLRGLCRARGLCWHVGAPISVVCMFHSAEVRTQQMGSCNEAAWNCPGCCMLNARADVCWVFSGLTHSIYVFATIYLQVMTPYHAKYVSWATLPSCCWLILQYNIYIIHNIT